MRMPLAVSLMVLALALALASETVLAPAVAADGGAVAASPGTLVFHVLLDGRPIGEHRFVIAGDAAARTVTSDAAFDVRFLGIGVYRYRHHAEERWSGDCLVALAAATDDDGRATTVKMTRDGDVDRVATNDKAATAGGCLMSYAYWNPALRTLAPTRLLNPQTGRVDAVRVERVGTGTVLVDGRAVEATRWRIAAPTSPVDLWISARGEWVGLDSTVSNGRHALSYRR